LQNCAKMWFLAIKLSDLVDNVRATYLYSNINEQILRQTFLYHTVVIYTTRLTVTVL